MKIFSNILLTSLAFAAQIGWSATYKCQIVSQPGLFIRNITWDGSTPFQYPIEYDGDKGLLKIRSIGLAGHPDYLFDVTVGDRILLSVSQERNLKDYNIAWRGDKSSAVDSIVSIACRTDGLLKDTVD